MPVIIVSIVVIAVVLPLIIFSYRLVYCRRLWRFE